MTLIFVFVNLCLCSKTRELFTLFAFATKEEAQRKIVFVPFEPKPVKRWSMLRSAVMDEQQLKSAPRSFARPLRPVETAVGNLQNFSLKYARCFDPNEEARLRQIIYARGTDTFEARIRELAIECESAHQQRNRKSSIRAASTFDTFVRGSNMFKAMETAVSQIKTDLSTQQSPKAALKAAHKPPTTLGNGGGDKEEGMLECSTSSSLRPSVTSFEIKITVDIIPLGSQI